MTKLLAPFKDLSKQDSASEIISSKTKKPKNKPAYHLIRSQLLIYRARSHMIACQFNCKPNSILDSPGNHSFSSDKSHVGVYVSFIYLVIMWVFFVDVVSYSVTSVCSISDYLLLLLYKM